MPRKSLPSYRLHRASGQAVVTLNGRDFYLGAYDTPESRREYDRLVAEWLASKRQPLPQKGEDLSVADLVSTYRGQVADACHAKERNHIRRALSFVTALYADLPAVDFGPLAFRAVREKICATPIVKVVRIKDKTTGRRRNEIRTLAPCPSRRYANKLCGIIKRAFRWAASREMIPESVYAALCTVEGLRRTDCLGRETPPVRPARPEDVEAAMPFVQPIPRDLVRLIRLTGMRTGEACRLRPLDVNTDGIDPDGQKHDGLWVVSLTKHKTAAMGLPRVVFLGPQAQLVLKPYLNREPEAYCFSPLECVRAYRLAKGQRYKLRKSRRPRDRYDTVSLGQAVRRACARAGVKFCLHMLRHAAATQIRSEFSPEHSRASLGQRSLQANQIYSELDREKAADVARRIG